MKTFRVKIYDVELDIIQDDDGKFIKPKIMKEQESYGTALKPAVEPIVCARKPLEGTYAENALRWNVAGLNIDGGRIEYKPRLTGTKKAGKEIKAQPTSFKGSGTRKLQTSYDEKMIETNQGRFPANLILECICDEVKIEPTETKKPEEVKGGIWQKSQGKSAGRTYKGGSQIHTNPECPCYILDKQSDNASRFFYCAKSSREERNRGLEEFEAKKVSDGRKKEADNAYQRGKTLRTNTHPTVKPLKLMEYLCLLTKTPKGGIILDPFAGSGSTGIAAKKVGRDYILIEKEPEYVSIAEARIKAVPQPLL